MGILLDKLNINELSDTKLRDEILREHNYDCDRCGSRIEEFDWCYKLKDGKVVCKDCHYEIKEEIYNDQKRHL